MDKLIQAIIAEVRIHYGITANKPTPPTLEVNIETRIKGYLAETLGIVKPQAVLDAMAQRKELAEYKEEQARQAEADELITDWILADNAKHLS